MPKLNEFLFGSSDKMKQPSLLGGGQKNLLDQLTKLLGGKGQVGQGFNQAFGQLQQYMDPNSELYKNFEQPYLQQFEQQTVPMLAERFAGYGGGMGGGLSSSGFGQALSAGASDLQTNLAQMKSTMGRQSINDLLNLFAQLSGQALGTRTHENVYQPGSAGLVGGMASGAAQGLGQGLAAFML